MSRIDEYSRGMSAGMKEVSQRRKFTTTFKRQAGFDFECGDNF